MRAPPSRFTPGNRLGLLRSGREYFPALISAIESAAREVWLECYIFADDPAGRMVADALVHAARRGVAVRAPDGRVVHGVGDLPLPAGLGPGEHRFALIDYGGVPMRVASLRGPDGAYVQIAETLHKRHRLVTEILTAEIATMIAVALAAIALAWTGIARGLRPLERLREGLRARSSRD